jgi:hypothetical protein
VSAPARAASGRGRAVLATDWWPDSLPDGTTTTPVTLTAHDGDVSRATLYQLADTKTVATLMHPRQDLQRAKQVPRLLEAGFAVFAQNSRDVNNDLRLVHENTLLDVAAGMEWLRDEGFESILSIGISGGASLYGYYIEQALLSPHVRIDRQPGGRPTNFADAQMPAPDALALVAPHPGQGRLLLSMIDASLVDDAEPLRTDPGLDPFSPANGFRDPPASSQYEPGFVTRYRDAQQTRVARIDDRAREAIAAQRTAAAGWKRERDVDALRRSIMAPVLVTYRTDADLRCIDMDLDASERPYGSIISPRPHISNFGLVGFGRISTPEAWLSTWSGLSSHASLVRAAPGVTLPTLVVEYTGDQSVFPHDVEQLFGALGSDDKTRLRVRADHFGNALDEREPDGVAEAMRLVADWAWSRLTS